MGLLEFGCVFILFDVMNYQMIFECIYIEFVFWIGQGWVVDYIFEFVKVFVDKFGMVVVMFDGNVYMVGDVYECFLIQSILKLFVCMFVFQLLGDELWEWVGCELFGIVFNLLVQFESECGKLCNLFINVGVLVVIDVLCCCFVKVEMVFVEFVWWLIGVNDIDYDLCVVLLELQYVECNCVMVYFMVSFGNMQMLFDIVIDVYCC